VKMNKWTQSTLSATLETEFGSSMRAKPFWKRNVGFFWRLDLIQVLSALVMLMGDSEEFAIINSGEPIEVLPSIRRQEVGTELEHDP
jgi:hypothetical protein